MGQSKVRLQEFKMDTNVKGQLGQTKVIVDLIEKGFEIFIPYCNDGVVDLIAIKDNVTYRLQCKYMDTLRAIGNCIQNHGNNRKYGVNDFDYYAIYLPNLDRVIYPSILFAGLTIRTELPVVQSADFYWWEDFVNFTDFAERHKISEWGLKSKYIPQLKSRKVERPSKEVLEKLVWEKPTTKIGLDFGVTDKAVEKWCKLYNIDKPSRGYWLKNTPKTLG